MNIRKIIERMIQYTLDCRFNSATTKKKKFKYVDCIKISIISFSRTDTLYYLNLNIIVLDDRFYDFLARRDNQCPSQDLPLRKKRRATCGVSRELIW